jgi:tripartite-type tricarboxylate transporter receptor subunit TctC
MRSLVVMQVHPSVPVRTVAELIAYAKANPGKVNMGSGGMGATGHVAGELFQMMTGIKLTHVPYRGEAPALTDLVGGQVQVAFTTLSSSIAYLRAGTLRPLAVSTTTRSPEIGYTEARHRRAIPMTALLAQQKAIQRRTLERLVGAAAAVVIHSPRKLIGLG